MNTNANGNSKHNRNHNHNQRGPAGEVSHYWGVPMISNTAVSEMQVSDADSTSGFKTSPGERGGCGQGQPHGCLVVRTDQPVVKAGQFCGVPAVHRYHPSNKIKIL